MKIRIEIELNKDITMNEAKVIMQEFTDDILPEFQDCYEYTDIQIVPNATKKEISRGRR